MTCVELLIYDTILGIKKNLEIEDGLYMLDVSEHKRDHYSIIIDFDKNQIFTVFEITDKISNIKNLKGHFFETPYLYVHKVLSDIFETELFSEKMKKIDRSLIEK